jgi:HlyD family secretion protein
MSKRIVIVGVLIVAATAFAVAWNARRGTARQLSVETGTVATHRIVETVTATGRIQPATQVNISADVSAKIVNLAVEEGDWVERGTLLLELDRERYEAAVESAEAALSSVKAQARLARENMIKAARDLERTHQLFEQNLESQATLDTTHAQAEVQKAQHESALKEVERSEAVLRQARDDLSKTTIYAPMAGTISTLNKEEGEIALGSQFQEDVILILADLQGMEAIVDVDENDIVSVALGDTASIEVDALPELVLDGEVIEIANSAKMTAAGTADQKTEFEVKVRVNTSAPQLRPGMTAAAEIVTEVREDAIGVPIQCVTVRTPEQLGLSAEQTDIELDRDGFAHIVWVVENGLTRARGVETGIQGSQLIEIVGGLGVGESVVTGSFRAISRDLRHGVAVTIAGSTVEEG